MEAPVSISAGIVYLLIFTSKQPFFNSHITDLYSDLISASIELSLEGLHLSLDLNGLNGLHDL